MTEPTGLDARDPLVIDRLIDGELTDAEERAIIAQLNDLPGGWRRCALAFLEARCWQRAARQVQALSKTPASETPGGPLAGSTWTPPQPAKFLPASAGRQTIRWPTTLALCALFLVAVGIGMLTPHPWKRPPRSVTAQPAEPATLAESLAESKVSGPSPTGLVELNHRPDSADLLLGNVKFVDNAGRQVEVPVYDWNEEVAEQLMYGSQPLSPEIVQQLKRHQVRSHRTYVPVRLQDGRQAVVPIQKLEIVPVEGIAY